MKDNICKGRINFNGTEPEAINDSFNVSGIVHNDVGDYTIAWDRDFADENYSAVAIQLDGTGRDPLILCVQAFGDQA